MNVDILGNSGLIDHFVQNENCLITIVIFVISPKNLYFHTYAKSVIFNSIIMTCLY